MAQVSSSVGDVQDHEAEFQAGAALRAQGVALGRGWLAPVLVLAAGNAGNGNAGNAQGPGGSQGSTLLARAGQRWGRRDLSRSEAAERASPGHGLAG